MTTRFSQFRSRQRSARHRSRKPNPLRIETLETRQMLAADMLPAGEVLDQELDTPSEDLSMSAIIKSLHDTAKAVIHGSIDRTGAGAEAPVDAAAADQVFDPAGDYKDDGSIELPPDWLPWFSDFGTVGRHDDIVYAAADTVGRDNLGAATVSSSSDSLSVPGGSSDDPMQDISFNSHESADIGLEVPLDTAVVDQVFELDDDTAAGNLGTSPTADTLEDNEGVTGDGSLATQSSIDVGGNSSPGGLQEAETGQETMGPENTGIEFGILDWLFGMEYDDVKTKDDIPDLRKVSYGKYEAARALGDSHEKASKAAGVEADGKWGKIFKRVYENDNGK